MITIIKNNYKEAREIANNIDEAKKQLTEEFFKNLELKIKENINKDSNLNDWITKLEDITNGEPYRKLWINKNKKKGELSIVLEGQKYSCKEQTILGLHSDSSNKKQQKKEGIMSYLEKTLIERDRYPKSGGAWLMYRPIFNFGNEDEFKKYTIINRDGNIDEVSSEIVDLVKQVENYFK